MIFGQRVEGCSARPIKSDRMAICEEQGKRKEQGLEAHQGRGTKVAGLWHCPRSQQTGQCSGCWRNGAEMTGGLLPALVTVNI